MEKLFINKEFIIYRPYKDDLSYKCKVNITHIRKNKIYVINGIDEMQAIILAAYKAYVEVMNLNNPERLVKWLDQQEISLYEIYMRIKAVYSMKDLLKHLHQQDWDIYKVYSAL